ncbi:helix-turn-helix domain-containing protein [Nonomuraea sp. NPDC050680]|uniref:helix-turn-helix domain-containing protein n=1 Tax=Nonomuraea sp. NPDC050680 TaxID=3154630 RepID=UPI0033CC15BA
MHLTHCEVALDESNEQSFNLIMGRIAGVTAAETRERLLRAAAEVFAERGYEGTRVADIATAAGVSNGALYAHFGSKAELLVAALRAHGPRLLADLLAADPDRSIAELLVVVGRRLPRQRDAGGYLIVEALVAARRDEEVAQPMRDYVGERADWLAGLAGVAESAGELDPALSANALAHFCLALAMGSALITPDLHAVDDEEWTVLLTRVVAALAPADTTAQAVDTTAQAIDTTAQTIDNAAQGVGSMAKTIETTAQRGAPQ